MAKPKYDVTKGEFQMSAEQVLEYWQDGELKLTGSEAEALLAGRNLAEEIARETEAQRPSNILRNLTDEDAAKLLDLAGIKHSGQ